MTTEKVNPIAIWQYVVVGLCHFGLGVLGSYFPLGQDYQGPGWPAIGIGAGFLVIWGQRLWRSVFASALALHFFFLNSLQISALFFAIGECGEIFLAALLLTRGLDWSKGFCTVQQMRRASFVALVAPLVGASMGTLGTWLSSELEGASGATLSWIFFHWWMRSALGFLMLAPVIGTWPLRPRLVFGANRGEGIAVTVLILGLCTLAFTNNYISHSFPLWTGLLASFVLLWCGARCGLFLTTHLAVVILACASFSFLSGTGVFMRMVSADIREMWWMVINLCTLSAISLSVLNTQAAVLAAKISSSRKRLELLVQNSPLAIVEWGLDFRVRVWSRKAHELFGFTELEVKGESGLELLVPVEGANSSHKSMVEGYFRHGWRSYYSSQLDRFRGNHLV